MKDKFIFNKKEYSAKEFSEYLNINIKTYYRWKERSLTPEEMYKQKQSGKNLMWLLDHGTILAQYWHN